MLSPPRNFPPPWSAEVTPNCFIVRDANGQALSYIYYESEPGRFRNCVKNRNVWLWRVTRSEIRLSLEGKSQWQNSPNDAARSFVHRGGRLCRSNRTDLGSHRRQAIRRHSVSGG